MGWFGNVLKKIAPIAAPIAGSALGSFLGPAAGLSTGIGGALGGALGGGLGAGLTSHNVGTGLLGAGLGGLGGYFTGPAINSTLGINPLGQSVPLNSSGFRLTGAGPMSAMGGSPGASGGAGQLASAIGNTTGAATDPSGGGIMDFIQKNPALLVGGVGAASQLMGNQGQTPAEKQIQKQAKQTNAQAQSMINAINSGQLPPGGEAALQNALNDTVTSIRNKYAQLGLSGSTMETQEIAAAQERTQAMRYDMALQTTQTGLQTMGLSSNLYSLLMQNQLQQDQNLSSALSNFTYALGQGQGQAA